MMASGCVPATTTSSTLVVGNSPAVVGRRSGRVSSCQLLFNATSTETATKCFASKIGSTNLHNVRSMRSRPSEQEQFRICSSLLASKSPLQCFGRLFVSAFSSLPLAAAPVGRNSAAALMNSRVCCSVGSKLGLENSVIRQTRSVLWGRKQEQRQRRPRAKDDDFEVDDDGGFDAMDLTDVDEEEEEDFRDYETEYEAPTGEIRHLQRESDTFINTEGEVVETVVAWKINEDEFHKISLLTCDFFIRKVPDPDDDVYDFREMYVTSPDTDIYSIPKVDTNLPKKPVRCTLSNYEVIHTTEPPVDEPRSPLAKTEYEVMKVFLTKHFKDRRADHENFVLDFEEIYVIDAKIKSFYRADVQVDVPGGNNRDRTLEVLVVRDAGTSFRIILEEDEKSPDEVVQAVHWEKTRESMENYLRGFRDYEISNWF